MCAGDGNNERIGKRGIQRGELPATTGDGERETLAFERADVAMRALRSGNAALIEATDWRRSADRIIARVDGGRTGQQGEGLRYATIAAEHGEQRRLIDYDYRCR